MRAAVLTRPRVPFKHSGMTIRRELLLALGGYDESLPIKVDVELILRALAARTGVEHFEIARPSLHEIFVRIAGPEAQEAVRVQGA